MGGFRLPRVMRHLSQHQDGIFIVATLASRDGKLKKKTNYTAINNKRNIANMTAMLVKVEEDFDGGDHHDERLV